MWGAQGIRGFPGSPLYPAVVTILKNTSDYTITSGMNNITPLVIPLSFDTILPSTGRIPGLSVSSGSNITFPAGIYCVEGAVTLGSNIMTYMSTPECQLVFTDDLADFKTATTTRGLVSDTGKTLYFSTYRNNTAPRVMKFGLEFKGTLSGVTTSFSLFPRYTTTGYYSGGNGSSPSNSVNTTLAFVRIG
jgi:hypothetical protein